MERHQYSLRLDDLSLLDIAELRNEIPPDQVEIVRREGDAGTHNELASTILLLGLAQPVLTAFVLWLLRRKESEKIEYKVRVSGADGSETAITLKLDRRSSQPPDAQAIEQIASALNVPREVLLSGLGA